MCETNLRKQQYFSINSKLFLLVAAIAIIGISCSQFQTKVKLISPTDHAVLSNNMPTLSWTSVPCEHYELWMDGIKMDTVAGR